MGSSAGMAERKKKRPEVADLDPRFARVVEAFADEPGVTFGGKGFGSTALKLNDKLFAMWTSKGFFCCKLPAARVDALVKAGQGEHFSTGGRLMKEWVSFRDEESPWLALAQEAFQFARKLNG
jgi:hypothetical protein